MSSIGSSYGLNRKILPENKTRIITYSSAFTLVPTYECFNHCAYCNFRVAPNNDKWLSLEQALTQIHNLKNKCVYEILVLSGEVNPKSSRRKSLINRVCDICQLALEEGFIPHSNVGPLSFTELKALRNVNGSMGLMLEQMAELPVHKNAPSKNPKIRLQQLDWAGQLKIPFTTGLLLGIGETEADRVKTLQAIATSHQKWGHIQEVILQPHSPGSNQSFDGLGFDPQRLPEVIHLAREILPEAIAIQIPPNLVADENWLLRCLEAGATDLGGIVPKDEVNPDYKHLDLEKLKQLLASKGWQLQPRLAVYPQYDDWLPPSVRAVVKRCREKLREDVNYSDSDCAS